MRADDPFLLGLGENVHDSPVALGPVAFSQAVHEADVDVVGAQFLAKTIEIGAGFGWIAGPGLGQDRDLVARKMFERLGHMGMAAVGVGSVEESQAVIVAVEQEIGQTLHAQRGLVGVMSAADRARPHGKTTGGNAGPAENDRIRRAEFAR